MPNYSAALGVEKLVFKDFPVLVMMHSHSGVRCWVTQPKPSLFIVSLFPVEL